MRRVRVADAASSWDGLCRLSQDPDPALLSILRRRMPTRALQPIVPAGVWEARANLLSLIQTFRIYQSTLARARAAWRMKRPLCPCMMLKDVAGGFAFELPGGEAKARGCRQARHLPASGKKPWPIGDGTVHVRSQCCVLDLGEGPPAYAGKSAALLVQFAV